jgi:hypothetical protein
VAFVRMSASSNALTSASICVEVRPAT